MRPQSCTGEFLFLLLLLCNMLVAKGSGPVNRRIVDCGLDYPLMGRNQHSTLVRAGVQSLNCPVFDVEAEPSSLRIMGGAYEG